MQTRIASCCSPCLSIQCHSRTPKLGFTRSSSRRQVHKPSTHIKLPKSATASRSNGTPPSSDQHATLRANAGTDEELSTSPSAYRPARLAAAAAVAPAAAGGQSKSILNTDTLGPASSSNRSSSRDSRDSTNSSSSKSNKANSSSRRKPSRSQQSQQPLKQPSPRPQSSSATQSNSSPKSNIWFDSNGQNPAVKTAVVVGGGWGGFGAALALAKAGAQVSWVEKDD